MYSDYILTGKEPEGLSKVQYRHFFERVQHFYVEDGTLYNVNDNRMVISEEDVKPFLAQYVSDHSDVNWTIHGLYTRLLPDYIGIPRRKICEYLNDIPRCT